MNSQSRLEDAFGIIRAEVEQAEEAKRVNRLITEAVRTGFAETPTEGEATGPYFDAVRERVVREVFAYWNEFRLPIGLKALVFRLLNPDRAKGPLGKLVVERAEKTWLLSLPSELTVRRRANEAASKEFAEKRGERQPLVCLGRSKQGEAPDSYYLPNPSMFQAEAREAVLAIVGAKA